MIEPENSWTIEKQTAQARNLSRFEELLESIPGKPISLPSISIQPIPRNEKAREIMADQRFIKYIPSDKAAWLRQYHPNAFLLLSLIAERARRNPGHIDGLEIGDAHIGDFQIAGIESRSKYRTALKTLVDFRVIAIKKTCRTRKSLKSTTEIATDKSTIGTLVTLLSNAIWDINECKIATEIATGSPPDRHRIATNKKEERKKKKEEEGNSFSDASAALLADFSSSILLVLPKFNLKKLNPTQANGKALDRLLKAYGEDKVRQVMHFAHSDHFWIQYVHTPVYLEKKFETLLLQMEAKGKQNENNPKHTKNNANEPSAEPKFVGRLVPE